YSRRRCARQSFPTRRSSDLAMRVDYVRVYEKASGPAGAADVWTTHGLDNVLRDARPPPDAPDAIRLTAARGTHCPARASSRRPRSEEHTSELQSRRDLVCRL